VRVLAMSVVVAGLVMPVTQADAKEENALVDRAAEAGIAQDSRSWSASSADFDGDGKGDVLVEFHQYVDSWVYRNDGDGTFSRAFRIARINDEGGILDRHDCQWYDVDGNGLIDFYCSGGRNMENYVKTATKDNELWLQLTPGSFTDRGTQWGVGDECSRGRMVAWIDVDGDGWKDLFVGAQAPRDVPDPCDDPANGYLPEGSKIWLNQAGDGLTYSPQWSQFKPNTGVRCAVPLDYDRDGRMDLLSCTFRNTKATLYRNTGTGFADMSASIPLGNLADAAAADLDGDGITDLALADVGGLTYRRGTGTGFAPAVRVWQAPPDADGFDLAVGDAQGDGRPDVYLVTDSTTSTTNPDDRLFLNTGGFTFTALTPPSAAGMGDAVTAVDVNGDGRAQFVVLNGADKAVGPVQLIALSVPGLVAGWGFDEGAGAVARDASPDHNDGTLGGGVAWTTNGRYGGAVSFDGVDDRVTVADSASIDLTGPLTVTAWVRPTSLGAWRPVLLKERSTGITYALYATNVANWPNGRVNIAGTDRPVWGASAIARNTWTHLAMTYDRAALRLYVNGTLARTVKQTGTVSVSDGPVQIGGSATRRQWFTGQLDDLRLYNRALTATEVLLVRDTPVTPG
jgi:hypothetical protein